MSPDLVDLERRFWLEGANPDFYRRHLADHVAMTFPGIDEVLDREGVLAAIAEGDTPVERVTLTNTRLMRLGEAVAVLTYRVDAIHRGTAIEARATSVYVDQGGEWRLAAHQRTNI